MRIRHKQRSLKLTCHVTRLPDLAKEVLSTTGNAMSVPVIGAILKSVLTSLASAGVLGGLGSVLITSAEAQAARHVRKMLKDRLRTKIAFCDGERLRFENVLLKLRTVKRLLAIKHYCYR